MSSSAAAKQQQEQQHQQHEWWSRSAFKAAEQGRHIKLEIRHVALCMVLCLGFLILCYAAEHSRNLWGLSLWVFRSLVWAHTLSVSCVFVSLLLCFRVFSSDYRAVRASILVTVLATLVHVYLLFSHTFFILFFSSATAASNESWALLVLVDVCTFLFTAILALQLLYLYWLLQQFKTLQIEWQVLNHHYKHQ